MRTGRPAASRVGKRRVPRRHVQVVAAAGETSRRTGRPVSRSRRRTSGMPASGSTALATSRHRPARAAVVEAEDETAVVDLEHVLRQAGPVPTWRSPRRRRCTGTARRGLGGRSSSRQGRWRPRCNSRALGGLIRGRILRSRLPQARLRGMGRMPMLVVSRDDAPAWPVGGVRLAELADRACRWRPTSGSARRYEHAQRSALMAVALADAAGFMRVRRRTLLPGAAEDHRLYGRRDFGFRAWARMSANGSGTSAGRAPAEFVGAVIRNVGRDDGCRGPGRQGAAARSPAAAEMQNSRIHCEVGQLLARRLVFGPGWRARSGRCSRAGTGAGVPRGSRARRSIGRAAGAARVRGGRPRTGCWGRTGRSALVARRRAGGGYDPKLVGSSRVARRRCFRGWR